MTKAILLNTTGQLETTNIIPLIKLRPQPNFKEVVYDNNQLIGVNIRVSSSGTILYSKTIVRTDGRITSIIEVDYTRNPPVSRTRIITRIAGLLSSTEVI